MVQGCAKCVKFLLFIFNFVILLGGLVIIGVGIWGLTANTSMERLLGVSLFMTLGIILIVGGVVIVAISFLGCCGALRESKFMLFLFSAILIAIFIAVLVTGILGYVYGNEVETRLQQEMLTTIRDYKQDEAITEAWDTVQQSFECCGLSVNSETSQKVWKRNSNFQGSDVQVPASCCKSQDSAAVTKCQADPGTNAYTEDCYLAVKEFFKKHAFILGGVAIGIAVILFFGILFSCILLNKIRRKAPTPAAAPAQTS